MTKTIIATGLSAAAMLIAAPAAASTWSDKIEQCVAAIDEAGLADTSGYRVKFDRGSARVVSLKLIPHDGGETMIAQCKMSRGKITAVSMEAA